MRYFGFQYSLIEICINTYLFFEIKKKLLASLFSYNTALKFTKDFSILKIFIRGFGKRKILTHAIEK